MYSSYELALDAGLDSVPRARRFARQALRSSGHELADIELAVAELVTNAVLYGEAPIGLRISEPSGCVRVEVSDAGKQLPLSALPRSDSMTGRGLGLVAALSSRWGIDRRPDGGKVVWVEFADGKAPPYGTGGAARGKGPSGWLGPPSLTGPGRGRKGPDERGAEPTYTVRLGAVPTDLLMDAKSHIDNLVRELTLAGAEGPGAEHPASPAVSRLVDTVTHSFAEARGEIKRQAIAAAKRGQTVTELVLHLPASAADAAEAYMHALDETDRQARAARLLTLATPPVHQVFRRWYLSALVSQLRAQAKGEPPPPPQTLAQALAEEVERLSAMRDAWSRLQLLEKLTGELTGALSVEQVAAAVAHKAVDFLGAIVVRVYVLDDDRVLRAVAAFGGNGALRQRYRQFSVDDDYPACKVVRSGSPLVLRSRAEIEASFPPLTGSLDDERTLHLLPLSAGGRAIGCIALSFPALNELEQASQSSFLTALADALAQALHRAITMQKLAEANERLSFLADVSAALASSLDFSATAKAIARLAVPRLADLCVLQVIEEGSLAAVAVLHSDPKKQASALRVAERYPTPIDGSAGPAQVLRSGRPRIFEHISEDALRRVATDAEHLQALASQGARSAIVVPLTGRSGTFGVMTLLYAGSRRSYRQSDLPFVEDVARRAALALETARTFEHQSLRLANVTSVAQVAQRAILAPLPSRLRAVALSARYLSAAAEAQVGGDLYEVVQRPGAVRLLIGDVKGKGLSAVRTAAVVMGEFRSAAADLEDLPAVAAQMDRRLRSYLEPEDFVTACIADLADDGRLSLVSCGHPPPLLARRGRLAPLEARPSVPLGLGSQPREAHSKLRPGDRLLLYTDGIVEARSPEGTFVTLADMAAATADAPFEEVLDLLLGALRTAVGATTDDDLALLLAEYLGPTG